MTPPNLSLIFIMVCFWITMWLVYRFLIQPVGAALADREGRIDGATSTWESTNQEYLAATDRLEREIAEAAQDALRVRSEYRQQAMDRRQATLEDARAAADEKLQIALESLDADTTRARQELRQSAGELAREFAARHSALHVLFATNLTLFLWLLMRFVGRPISGFLDARASGITRKLEEAREKVAEAESLHHQVQQRLDELGAEVAAMKQRAERDGEAEAAQVAEKTVTEQERFLKRVEEEITRRSAEARANLSKETAELTAKLTKDLLKQELTEDDRRSILERSLSAMGSESGRD